MVEPSNRMERLTPELRASLVAFLDGELDEAGTRAIERVLAHSPIARHDVDMLTRTWQLLDVLPRATPSETFTQQTMETIRLEEVRPELSSRPWFQKLQQGTVAVCWLAALLVASSVGFLLTWQWLPRGNETLIRDLDVIEQLDTWRAAGDIRFLQELDRNNLFTEEPPD
ncbi:MAG: hypothetical protein KDA79_22310 [Planctomycetaceae bacterium]|nr:hypothetical protein [Planctomycetaceae bacterium]